MASTVKSGEWFGHPRGLAILFGTEMWERFCYYGMRALLTLYMVKFLFIGATPDTVMGYHAIKSVMEALNGALDPQQLASLIYGLFTGLVYLTPIIGGAIADNFVGQRSAVIIGGLTMAAGEFLLTVPSLFFIGLLVLMVGNGFFKPNISTQVGGLYRPGDPRIDRAFSVFYVGINLGALLAPVITGRLGIADAGAPPTWHWGFAAAGVGMLLALVIYVWGQRYLPPDVRERRRSAVVVSGAPAAKLTSSDWRAIFALMFVAILNMFFWGCYEQQGITIALMAADNSDLSLPFFRFNPADVQAFNPFFIFALTPVIVALWGRQSAKGSEPASINKMALGCLLNALGFAVLIIPGGQIDHGAKVSVLWLIGSICLMTIGELYLSPVALALFNKAAPAKVASLMMAVCFLSNFGGNSLAGYLGKFWGTMPKAEFFTMIAVISAFAGVAIALVGRVLIPILREREKSTLATVAAFEP